MTTRYIATAILPPGCLDKTDAEHVLGEIGPVAYDTYSIRVSLVNDESVTDAARRMGNALDELLHESELVENVDQFIIQVQPLTEKVKYG